MGRILRIRLFGPMSVHDSARDREVPLSGPCALLFAFLVVGRHRSHARHALAGLFWGEHPEQKASSSLSTAIWRIRRALDPDGPPWDRYVVSNRHGDVRFNRESDYWLDIEAFEEALTRGVPDARRGDGLDQALALYRGGLLEGVYDHWAMQERERLALLRLRALQRLMTSFEESDQHERALSVGRQILAQDPIREDVHRALMRIYSRSGRRSEAARQYRECEAALAEELGIAPMEETQLLFRELCADAEPPAPDRRDPWPAMAELRRAVTQLEGATQTIRRAIEIAEGQDGTPAPRFHGRPSRPERRSSRGRSRA